MHACVATTTVTAVHHELHHSHSALVHACLTVTLGSTHERQTAAAAKAAATVTAAALLACLSSVISTRL